MTDAAPSHAIPRFANAAAQTPPGAVRPLPPFTRLRGLLRPDRGDLLAVAAFALAIGVMLLATPVAVQAVVNSVSMGGAVAPLVVVTLMLFVALGFAGLLSAMQSWTVEMLQRRLFVRMVADLAARLPRVRHDTYDERYGPDLVNRFFDVVTIQKVGSILLLDGLSILLSVLVGLVVLAFYHPLLLAFDVVLLAVITLLVLGPMRRGTRTAVAESKAKYAVVGWFEEVARNPVPFKAGGAEQWVLDRADELARAYLDRRGAHYRTVFGQVIGALGLQVLAHASLLGIGGFLVVSGALTLGQLVAAELIVTLVVSSVAKMGKHLESFYDLMASTDKIGELLDLPVESGGDLDATPRHDRGVSLELIDVGWAPPRGEPVLRGVSLAVGPGERLGITGPSGAGKSTLLELLWRLRAPTRGAVQVDGRDLRELSGASFRGIASLVGGPVDVVVGTIRDNVRLGRPDVSDEDVARALRRVGLHERVSLLPDGADTVLWPSGRPLSGGEVRRLLIARAIAGSPRLLMVQDFLDHADAATRAGLVDLLFDPAAPWTLVVVSSAPEVLERCDRVLALPGPKASAGAAGPRPAAPATSGAAP